MPELDPSSELAMKSMLGRVGRHLDLALLERALAERRIGGDLSDALTRLGHPPSVEAAQRRADKARSAAARAALREDVESWPEPWAPQWADDLVKAGLLGDLDSRGVADHVKDIRRLLDHLNILDTDQHNPNKPSSASRTPTPVSWPPGPPQHNPNKPSSASRTEVAAALFGSSHALDPGTKLAALAARALRLRLGTALEGRELWEAAGLQSDRVSAPVLVWALPVTGRSPLDEVLRAAQRGQLPLHVSLLALLRHPVTVSTGAPVLVVENPRLVEAAAERRLTGCVVSANGNPTTAVTTLLRQMQHSGARLCYHGDFDTPGIAMCQRMHKTVCKPWMMDASHYEEAVSLAADSSVQLERSSEASGPTPWDPKLKTAFDTHRLIVHEEFVLDNILNNFSRMSQSAPGS